MLRVLYIRSIKILVKLSIKLKSQKNSKPI